MDQDSKSALKKKIFYYSTRLPRLIIISVNRFLASQTIDKPFHPREEYPWQASVEAQYPAVRADVEKIVNHIEKLPSVHEILPSTEYYYPVKAWRQVMFYTYGNRIDDNCAIFPNIERALLSIPGLITGSLSVVEPGETIPPHQHYYKGLLIFHFAIIVPKEKEKCEIRVGNEKRHWNEGEIFVIDPTFDHEVWNNTDERRIVLLGEFRRPDMPRYLRFLDHVFIWLFNMSPLGKNMTRRVRAKAAVLREQLLSTAKLTQEASA